MITASPQALAAIGIALLVMVPMGFFADRRLEPGSFERAVWSLAQLAVGLLLFVAGQVWSIRILRKSDVRVGWVELTHPLRLWGQAAGELPRTVWPLGLGSAGTLAILISTLWVGGHSYWLRQSWGDSPAVALRDDKGTPENKKKSQIELERMSVARDLALRMQSEPKKPEETPAPTSPLAASTASSFVMSKSSAAAPRTSQDPRPTEKCVVIGFLPAADGQSAGLVLATLREGKLAYAGIVRKGIDESSELLTKLTALSRTRPILDGLDLNAVWVKPSLYCEVHQSGTEKDGALIDPQLKGILED